MSTVDWRENIRITVREMAYNLTEDEQDELTQTLCTVMRQSMEPKVNHRDWKRMLKDRKQLAEAQRVFPAFGKCCCCGMPCNVISFVHIQYCEGSAIFALCRECWVGLIPEVRVKYYDKLVDEWERQSPGTFVVAIRDQVREAVLAEREME